MVDRAGVPESVSEGEDARARIVAAAAQLIAEGGRDAATTRAVAAAAGVQAPTIYRLFGDKRALLDAVAQDGLAAYVAEKAAHAPHPDPVQDLRLGWDTHVAFGLAHPALFAIMAGDVQPRPLTASAEAGLDVLQRRIRNIALAGRLRVSQARAQALIESACVGTVLKLLQTPTAQRDPELSTVAREAVIAAITTDAAVGGENNARGAAAALRASLDETQVLSAGEKALLVELLDRIADVDSRPAARR